MLAWLQVAGELLLAEGYRLPTVWAADKVSLVAAGASALSLCIWHFLSAPLLRCCSHLGQGITALPSSGVSAVSCPVADFQSQCVEVALGWGEEEEEGEEMTKRFPSVTGSKWMNNSRKH